MNTENPRNSTRRPIPVSPWVSLAERLIVIAFVLPSCHLVWTMVLSSELVRGRDLPLAHEWIANWVIGPRVLLILPVVFVAGLLWSSFPKEGGHRWRDVFQVASTLVVVSALCVSAIALAALLFPIQWMPPS